MYRLKKGSPGLANRARRQTDCGADQSVAACRLLAIGFPSFPAATELNDTACFEQADRRLALGYAKRIRDWLIISVRAQRRSRLCAGFAVGAAAGLYLNGPDSRGLSDARRISFSSNPDPA